MTTVLMTLFRRVRDLAIALRPIAPASVDNLLDQMGIPASERDYAALEDLVWFERLAASGFTVAQPIGVFPRLELPAEAPA
jgi:methionyl-tRNA synthetase